MGRLATSFIALFLLASCSGPIETRISSTGPGVATPTSILGEKLEAAAPNAAARDMVAAKLAERGFTLGDAGALQLHVAVSERDAAIAVATEKNEISKAKRRKPLQSCADKEYRLAVALTRISDGALVYRGSAAEYHCKATLAQAMPALADSALTDLAAPKGDHVVTRTGVE
jgi:hypothetical protein